jgi:hypothetical protein
MKPVKVVAVLLLAVFTIPAQDARQEIAAMKHVHFYGGPGDARENAVIIEGAKSQTKGMEAEYYFISLKYGKKDKGWRLVGQSQEREKPRVFDVLEIEEKATSTHFFYYFDLTQCSWVAKDK